MNSSEIAKKMLMRLHGHLISKNLSEFGNTEYTPTNDVERLAFKVGFENRELSEYDISFVDEWYSLNNYEHFENNYDLDFHETYSLKLAWQKHREFKTPEDPFIKEVFSGRWRKS